MSKYQGGMIGSVANATSGTAYTGRANGVFPLPQQIVAKSSSLWAIGQTRPNPPTIGTATGTGATTISVAFIPPVQYGGSPITSYTVTSSGGQTATGSSSPIVVSGLSSTTYYTFTVTATNALGTSDSSGTSNSVQPAITDPYFSSVSLLLNGDTLTDLSSSPKTITNTGSVAVNTSVKKFGTGSMALSGSNYLTINSPILDLGAGSFTIELWWNSTLKANYQSILIGTGNLGAWLHETSTGGMLWGINGGTFGTSSIDVCDGIWHHVAFVRNGTSSCTLYIDGVSSVTASDSTNITGTTTATIGTYIGGRLVTGYIDDLRITKGIARYTTNFTPPTAAFPTL